MERNFTFASGRSYEKPKVFRKYLELHSAVQDTTVKLYDDIITIIPRSCRAILPN
jgi:hypothetical protein